MKHWLHVHLLIHSQRLSVYEACNYDNLHHCVITKSAFYPYIPAYSPTSCASSTVPRSSGGLSFHLKGREVALTCLTFSVFAHSYFRGGFARDTPRVIVFLKDSQPGGAQQAGLLSKQIRRGS